MRRKRHLTLLKGDPIAQPTITPAADDTVAVARANDRSVAAEIRRALAEHLERRRTP